MFKSSLRRVVFTKDIAIITKVGYVGEAEKDQEDKGASGRTVEDPSLNAVRLKRIISN
jgi:hypothetical protein